MEEALVAFPELRHDNTTIHTLSEYIGRLVGKTTDRLALLQNFEAEQTERQLQKMQAEKIKQVRMLLADTITSFDQLKKLRPVP